MSRKLRYIALQDEFIELGEKTCVITCVCSAKLKDKNQTEYIDCGTSAAFNLQRCERAISLNRKKFLSGLFSEPEGNGLRRPHKGKPTVMGSVLISDEMLSCTLDLACGKSFFPNKIRRRQEVLD